MLPLYFFLCITQYRSLCYHDTNRPFLLHSLCLAIPCVISLVFCRRVHTAHVLPACYQPSCYFTLIYVYLLFCLYNRSCPVRQVIDDDGQLNIVRCLVWVPARSQSVLQIVRYKIPCYPEGCLAYVILTVWNYCSRALI